LDTHRELMTTGATVHTTTPHRKRSTPQGHTGRDRPSNTWNKDLEQEMWIVDSVF